jgi:hypothetical protein
MFYCIRVTCRGHRAKTRCQRFCKFAGLHIHLLHVQNHSYGTTGQMSLLSQKFSVTVLNRMSTVSKIFNKRRRYFTFQALTVYCKVTFFFFFFCGSRGLLVSP